MSDGFDYSIKGKILYLIQISMEKSKKPVKPSADVRFDRKSGTGIFSFLIP